MIAEVLFVFFLNKNVLYTYIDHVPRSNACNGQLFDMPFCKVSYALFVLDNESAAFTFFFTRVNFLSLQTFSGIFSKALKRFVVNTLNVLNLSNEAGLMT